MTALIHEKKAGGLKNKIQVSTKARSAHLFSTMLTRLKLKDYNANTTLTQECPAHLGR